MPRRPKVAFAPGVLRHATRPPPAPPAPPSLPAAQPRGRGFGSADGGPAAGRRRTTSGTAAGAGGGEAELAGHGRRQALRDPVQGHVLSASKCLLLWLKEKTESLVRVLLQVGEVH